MTCAPEALDAGTVPQGLPAAVQTVPLLDSVQFTPLLLASFVTIAVNGCVPVPVSTDAPLGVTTTTIGGVIVIAAVEVVFPSAIDVAVRVGVLFGAAGAVAGAA